MDEEAKKQINDLQHKEAKNNQSEQQEEKRIQKNEDRLRSLWDNIKHSSILIIGVPEQEKEQEIENLFEQRVPNKMGPKRTTPRHIIIKMPKVKDKERILKAAREKQSVTYKGVPIRRSADFSKDTLQARRDWQEVFKVMKSKDLQPRLLYPAKLSFRMEGQIKCFPSK